MLPHNRNIHPSLSLAHSVQFKEENSSVKILLDALKYKEYCLDVIEDFKMMGLQVSLSSLPLRYKGHHGTLFQAGVFTADRD